jgi:hypothetical protein
MVPAITMMLITDFLPATTKSHEGFLKWESPIAGWFISWEILKSSKIHFQNWGNLHFRKSPFGYESKPNGTRMVP